MNSRSWEKRRLLCVFILMVCVALRADIVTLKNGQTIEGTTRKVGENMEIITGTARLVLPTSSIAKIEKKEFITKEAEGTPLTPEQLRQKKAQSLFHEAEVALDKMDTVGGIMLLEKAVDADPCHEEALEKLIRLLYERRDFKKAKEFLDQLKKVKPLLPEWQELETRISDGCKKLQEREQIAAGLASQGILTGTVSAPGAIPAPQGTPAADFSGAYYVEYSYCARIQQRNDIATVALYAQNPQTPAVQFSASVRANGIILDLSRINPAIAPESIFATINPEDGSYSLNNEGTVISLLGKKITNEKELEGFQQLLAGNYEVAITAFELAVRTAPDNPHILFGLGRAQMLSGRAEMALVTFDKIKENTTFTKYFLMEKLLNISRDYAEAKVMSARGENAIDDYEAAFKQFPLRVPDFGPFASLLEKNDSVNTINAGNIKRLLEPYAKTFKAIENTYKKSFCRWPVDGSLSSTSDTPDASNYLTLAQLILLQAKLATFENRFDDALLWSRRLLRMGEHLNHGRLEQRRLGMKIQKLGAEAFRDLICAIQTPEQADETAKILNEILLRKPPTDYQNLVTYERVEWPNVDKSLYTEAALRARIETVYLSMLPVAVASKKYYLIHNHLWPASESMLVPDYLPELVIDPFSKEPLKVFPLPVGFRIYSIGPDRTDDRGNTPFEPSRGLNSNGDILMDVK